MPDFRRKAILRAISAYYNLLRKANAFSRDRVSSLYGLHAETVMRTRTDSDF